MVDDESSTWRIVCLMLSRMAAIVVDEIECVVVSKEERRGGERRREKLVLWGWSKTLS